MMLHAKLILGRDGMGSNSEEYFGSWFDFVCDELEGALEALRLDVDVDIGVDVETRRPRDVQSDAVYAADDGHLEIIERTKVLLWNRFCAARCELA